MQKWIALIILGIIISMKSGGNMVNKIAQAIKKFEGWYPGSRSFRNNNPGNIRWSGSVPSDGSGSGVLRGAIGKDETNHLIYRSESDGWNALIFQIRIAITGKSSVYSPSMNLYQFFEQYAEGNQKSYAETVAYEIGVSPYSKLEELA